MSRDLHASAIRAGIERFLFIPPNVLVEFGAFFDVEFHFVHFVVTPSGGVAPTDCALAFVDFLWLTRHDHGDGAAMAGGFEGFVRHFDKLLKGQSTQKVRLLRST